MGKPDVYAALKDYLNASGRMDILGSEILVEFLEHEDGWNNGVDHADQRALSLARPHAPGSGNGHTAEAGRGEALAFTAIHTLK